MALSSDLISQFVQVTKDDKTKKETTVYGTIVEYEGNKYVKLDGSELLTPISLTADAIDGERVTVMIKNHNAIVTGNMSSPAARTEDVKNLDAKISEFEIIIADKVSTERLEAEIARIDTLVSENVTIKGRLDANEASINELEANNVTINGKLEAAEAEITDLKTKKLDAEVAEITYATIANLEAAQAKIGTLEATYGDFQDLTTKNFEAVNASIDDLNANKLSVKDADIKYANIDFANITQAAVEKIFSDSGIIKDLIVSSGQITGELVGVTIKGDLIEGGTVVADKLVVKGSDGLYYKLNTDGSTVESEQTEYNSLNGSVITAKSITATKISVDDLVAFGATIGGFNITKSSLYSGVKASVNNTTRGIYLDKEGQVAFGDASNFLKYYKAEDGSYKLEVSAQSIKFSASDKNLETALDNTIVKTVEEFYQSVSPTELSGGEWSTTQPTWEEGKYIWRRTAITYGDGRSEYSPSSTGVCITGNTGANGDPGEAGKGIASTVVEYQVSASGTIAPTGEWTSTVPETTAEMPYLWSRTIFTYTDNTTSVSYAVGSTPDGLLEIVNGEISDVRSEFKATTDSISGEVSSVTTKLYDLSSQVNTNASSFQQFADSINATIINTMVGSGEWAGLTEEMTAIKATATGLSMDVSKVTQNLDGFMAEYHTYFTATADGLQISKSGSEFTTLLSDIKLSFTQSGEEVAYIQYNKLYITEAWVKSGLSIESSTNRSYIRQYVDGNGLFCIQIKEGA